MNPAENPKAKQNSVITHEFFTRDAVFWGFMFGLAAFLIVEAPKLRHLIQP